MTRILSAAVAACAVVSSVQLHAERRPLRAWTMSDGLAHDRVESVLADSRGFVWFSTANGISRFDGSRFVNYGVADGLPAATALMMLERADGSYLVGTNGGGVGRYAPDRASAGRKRFEMFGVSTDGAANRVNVLYRSQHHLWAGTDDGLFEILDDGRALDFRRVGLEEREGTPVRVQVLALAEDAGGRLWIGTSRGVGVLDQALRPANVVVHRINGVALVRTLLIDRKRGIWAGHDAGLSLIEELPTPDGGSPLSDAGPVERRRYTGRDGLPHDRVNALLQAADGTIWIGTMRGLAMFADDRVSSAGLPSQAVRALAEDRDRHLWIAVVSGGVVRLASHGFTSYTTDDGLAGPYVEDVIEADRGSVAVVTRERMLSVFDGERFEPVRPNLPGVPPAPGGARYSALLLDRAGAWWVEGGGGLFRFPVVRSVRDLARVQPSAFYTARDGLASGDVWHLFEDSRGDIWISTRAPGRDVLTRWDRATGTFHRYGEAQGLSASRAVECFGEDRAGQVWIGFWDGGAARLRNGRFELLRGFDHPVMDWHTARDGTLWGASLGGGLLRIDRPEAVVPSFVTLAIDQGLPSDRAVAITEDEGGRLYVGSPLGLMTLDPVSGNVAHYTQEDGLAHTEVKSAFRDRSGALWFGTDAGVSRFIPDARRVSSRVRLLVGAARINGADLPIPDLGTDAAGPFVFDPTQRHVEIDYIALGTQTSGLQYRLLGADDEWTTAGNRRTVNYARLASGSYRFVVRAPDGGGWSEASMTFAIRPPVWARGWFVATASIFLATVLFAAHRARVAHVTAVERVRTRIASDLHDDIGTNLSQIAILGELLKRQSVDGPQTASLARIAELSRESVDSLGDIVWSIDPEKDHLGNLTIRMRRLASDLLSAHDIDFTFAVHGALDRTIGAEIRRNVFLAYKETLNNVVRHAACQMVRIDVRLQESQLAFTVSDDGRGFDASQPGGHGLTSLRLRAERFGGRIDISSTGAGTTVVMSVPDKGPRFLLE